MIRVVSWNVGTNTGYSWEACRQYLESDLRADLMLLQEAPVDESSVVALARCERTSWGSTIATSLDARVVELAIPDELRPWLRIAAAYVNSPFGELFVASVHPHYEDAEYGRDVLGPLSSYRLANARYIWHCDLVYGVLHNLLETNERFVIGGDWNTDRAFQGTSVPDAAVSIAFFDRALRGGWHDVLYENEVEVPTYTKNGSKYQLDHVFCDAQTAAVIRSIEVRRDVLERGLSDHAPIVLDIDR